MSEAVLSKLDGHVMTLTLNRPERRNAMNDTVIDGLRAGIEKAENDPDIRAIVITGAGDEAFCAGGDLKGSKGSASFGMEPHDPRHPLVDLFRAMEACRVPIIARVNGHALAGGFGLVCACDLAVARDDAKMGVTEAKVGIFPMMILPYLLRITPARTLMELCLTGDLLTGAEAAERNIVNRAVSADKLDEITDELVAKIVSNSPSGIRLGKQGLARIRDMNFDAALEYAQFMLANMVATEDAREGFAAFAEKRKPQWTGR